MADITVVCAITKEQAVSGTAQTSVFLEFRPTVRRVDGAEVVLPEPVFVRVKKGEAVPSVILTQDDGTTWAWKVIERGNSDARGNWFYFTLVGESGSVNYCDLVEIDPDTLAVVTPGTTVGDALADLEAADVAIQAAIDAEVIARVQGDTTLTDAVNAEATARATGDADLQTQIDAMTANAQAVTSLSGLWAWPGALTSTPSWGQVSANAAPASASELYFHTTDSQGSPFAALLAVLGTGSSIIAQAATTAESWARYTVTGEPTVAGDVVTVPVQVDASGTAPLAGWTQVRVVFSLPGGAVDYDAVTAALVNDDASDTRASLDARTVALTSLLPGARFAWMGDSIMRGAVGAPIDGAGTAVKGPAWPTYAAVMANQRFRDVVNVAEGGNTTATMLSRWDDDVVPNADLFDVLVIELSTNDGGNDVPLATTIAQTVQMIEQTYALGKVPVLVGIGPNLNDDDARRDAQTVRNAWARDYAANHGLIFVDFYGDVTDPATGGWKSGYSDDGTHPTEVAQKVIAQRFIDEITPRLPPGRGYVSMDNFDGCNDLPNPCFIDDTIAGGSADDWTLAGAGTHVVTVEAADADSFNVGKWQTFDGSATATSVIYVQPATVSRPQVTPGDVIEFTTLIRTTGLAGGMTAEVQIQWRDGSGVIRTDRPYDDLGQDVTGMIYYRAIAPATAVEVNVQLYAKAGTGKVQYALPTWRNLTALGLV